MEFTVVFFANSLSAVYTRLESRGWIQQVTNSVTGQLIYVPTIPHLEMMESSINVARTAGVLNPDGTLASADMYPQMMLFVRVTRDRMADETSEDAQTDASGNLREITLRTKIGKWVVANSTAVTLTGYIGPTYQQQISMPARKMNGVNIWLMRETVASVLMNWQ